MFRTVLIVTVVAVAILGARAEEPVRVPAPPEFVPFTVDQKNFETVRNYLLGLKYGEAAPLMNWLEGMEGQAKAAWTAEHMPKKE